MSLSLFIYISLFIFVIGICLGSFYNVVILRSLSNESIILPPSKCPKCGHKLYWWHNIPILSYLILRGKCHFCKEKISIQYPIVELVTGILFVIPFLKFGFTSTTLFAIFCISCLIIMTGTDLKEKLVDCNIAIGMVIIGLIYAFLAGGKECLLDSFLGTLIGFAAVELVARFGYILKKGRAMGEADSYVAAALGAAVGYHDIGWVLLYSLIASMLFILPMFWYERYKAKDALTLFLFSVFFIFAGLQLLFQGIWWIIIPVIISGLALAVVVVRNVSKAEKLNYLPYVPALFAGFLYYIIFVI